MREQDRRILFQFGCRSIDADAEIGNARADNHHVIDGHLRIGRQFRRIGHQRLTASFKISVIGRLERGKVIAHFGIYHRVQLPRFIVSRRVGVCARK